MLFDLLHNKFDGPARIGLATRRGKLDVPESGLAMHVCRRDQLANHRRFGPSRHRDVGSACELYELKGIA